MDDHLFGLGDRGRYPAQTMNATDLQKTVDAIVGKQSLGGLKPHELLASLHRKKLPAGSFAIVEPLLHIEDGATYKYAIDIVGKIKDAPTEAVDSVEQAWERSWLHGVPQACTETFRALLRLGNCEDRLIKVIDRAMMIDNYGIHKDCAETLMKMEAGNSYLANWRDSMPGNCDCHLHRKLAAKIERYVKNAG